MAKNQQQRNVSRDPVRETVREPVRDGAVQVQGRDGKLLSRKRGGNADKFYIPQDIIPDGWSYEWKTESILGEPQTAHQMHMAENGWTPVMADRHPGLFMPNDYKGPIRRDGMVLMERPIELTQEARYEEQLAAQQLMNAQKEQLGLALPSGFDQRHPGARPKVNRSFEPADVARPRLEIDA